MAARAFIVFALLGFATLALAQFDYFGGFTSGSARDPRANTGPVVFPMTSIGSETSGVRVGASGYGFVPPGARGGIGSHGAGPNPGLPLYPGLTYF